MGTVCCVALMYDPLRTKMLLAFTISPKLLAIMAQVSLFNLNNFIMMNFDFRNT